MHEDCPPGCSVLTVASQGASWPLGHQQLPGLWQGEKRGREVFWLCSGQSKHSSIFLGIGAVPGCGSDVPAAPPGSLCLLFPLAQAGALLSPFPPPPPHFRGTLLFTCNQKTITTVLS